MAGGKNITGEQHDGDLGESIAAVLIKEMGHEFHPAGRNEAGIDGFVELRDRATGNVDAQIIVCQVKSGESAIFDETESAFSWRADPGDLSYWENSNAPTIVVVIRLATREGWWRAVDEAFPDEAARASRIVRFDKFRDRLNDAPGDVLHAVVRRDRERRRASTQLVLAGPYAAIGLTDELARARQFEMDREWDQSADAWEQIASAAAARGLDRRLVWPALESAARARETAGTRQVAGELWLRLALERIDDDDPQAVHNVARAQWTGVWTGSPDQLLLSTRVHLAEAGTSAIDDLREVLRLSKKARDRQAAAAALVDALTYFGAYEEAYETANVVLGKRHDTPHKRQLVLDLLDCAGHLGHDVASRWAELLADCRDRGPFLYARVLQRRAVDEVRRGDPDEASAYFHKAAEVWAATDGAEEQVAEVAFSAALAHELAGRSLSDGGPPGARAAAAIARGSIRTPAVRSDRLINAGPAYAVDKNLPDALARLTMAAMLDRRAGNLASWRQATYLLARTYEDADEAEEALRLWLLIGATSRAAETASKLEADVVLRLARLDSGPGWQRSAGFAALDSCAADLSRKAVASIAKSLLTEAAAAPTLLAAHPSLQARRLLAKVSDRLPKRHGKAAGEILTEEIRVRSPNAPEASAGLVALTQRNLFDGLPPIIDALLSGDVLPVTIAGWLKEADATVRAPLVDAALAGNVVALGELAAADIPEDDVRLRRLCDKVTRASIKEEIDEDSEVIGMSYVDQAQTARFARQATQREWTEMLCDVVASPRYDEVSKTSALVALAVASPDLEIQVARSALERLLPSAAGEPVHSAPAVLTDHPNPKRARSRFTRAVPDAGVQAAALQACCRLTRIVDPASREVEKVLLSALESGQVRLTAFSLRELSGLLALGVEVDPQRWRDDPEPMIRSAAEQLARARRGQPTTE